LMFGISEVDLVTFAAVTILFLVLEHFQLVLSTRPWYSWRPGGAHGRGVLDGFA